MTKQDYLPHVRICDYAAEAVGRLAVAKTDNGIAVGDRLGELWGYALLQFNLSCRAMATCFASDQAIPACVIARQVLEMSLWLRWSAESPENAARYVNRARNRHLSELRESLKEYPDDDELRAVHDQLQADAATVPPGPLPKGEADLLAEITGDHEFSVGAYKGVVPVLNAAVHGDVVMLLCYSESVVASAAARAVAWGTMASMESILGIAEMESVGVQRAPELSVVSGELKKLLGDVPGLTTHSTS